VGCQNWNHFWLNEGLNTFMERKVTSILRGINFTKIEYFTGNTSMYYDMLDYGLDDSYSSLFPDIGDDDPENSFSGIIYEKGSQFVYYLETLLGEEMMQSLLRLYINTFAQTAINSMDFKQLYEQFVVDNFANADEIIAQTQWDAWITGPGLPPVTLDFRTDELEEAQALAQAYVSLEGASSPPNVNDFADFFSSQKVAFVQALAADESVDAALMTYIDSNLNLSNSLDPMVKNTWYEMGIKKDYEPIMDLVYIWIGEQGRNAYIRPIFQAMVDADNCDMGKVWFEDYKPFYNSYVVGGLTRVLSVCAETTDTAAPDAVSTTATIAPAATPTAGSPTSAATMVDPWMSAIAMMWFVIAAAY
jgi:leukotriene-A4 hydrolase